MDILSPRNTRSLGDSVNVVLHLIGEAGSLWRIQKAYEYRERAKQLGLENEKEFEDLLSTISAETAFLENLWESQKVHAVHNP
jgi:hypothetical protein